MNPRQRRGILLLAATAIGAIVVFVAVAAYVGDVRSKVGPYGPVLELTTDVTELQPVTPDMLAVVQVPQRWISATAITNFDDAVGLVASGNFGKGARLENGMLEQRPGLQPGYREVAIIVDAETGVAGKVTAGDRVDIIATVPQTELTPARAEIWVENALVLEVGVPEATETTSTDGGFSEGNGVPVTFALPVDEALRLAYAESFSTKLRLALRGGGDEATIEPDKRIFQQEVSS